MRELERDLPRKTAHEPASAGPTGLLIAGRGRAGGAIGRAARAAGLKVAYLERDADPAGGPGVRSPDTAVLLCVPDAAIAAACERVASAGPALVGHVSGATPLAALDSAAKAGARTFSMHPLQTIPDGEADLQGAPCAVAGSDDAALAAAEALAARLGMLPFAVPEEGRIAYHAAATLASNSLVALEESAAALLAAAGVSEPRAVLAPLVLRTAANWADRGAAALTGPIARGDEETIARHREALQRTAPELVPLYEALAERTRAVARGEAR